MTEKEEKKPAVNWVQVASGALAAVTSAVLLSTLGVAGTLIGAAVGSVAASVGSALYSRTITVSRERVAAQAAALRRVSDARARLDEAEDAVRHGDAGAGTSVRSADQALGEAEQALHDSLDGTPSSTTAGGGDGPEAAGAATWRDLPWKAVGLSAFGVFVAAMVAISVFELTAGRPVSSFTGGTDRETGTTVPGLTTEETPSPDPSDPSEEPLDDPAEPGVSPTEEPGEPPSEEPTVAPSEEPAPTEVPSEPTVPDPTSTPTE